MGKNRKSVRGSIFVMLFMAVGLIALLSYVLLSTSRSGGPSNTKEVSAIGATEILQYAGNINTAVKNLLVNGCTDTQISFERPPFDGSDTDYVNTSSPADDTCHVFHPNGGGVLFQTPEASWLDQKQSALSFYGSYLFTGTTCIPRVGTGSSSPCSGSASSLELIMFLPFIKKEVCEALLVQLGIINSGGSIPQNSGAAYQASGNEFKGTYSNALTLDAGSSTYGKFYGCFQGDTTPPSGTYTFYAVLIPR